MLFNDIYAPPFFGKSNIVLSHEHSALQLLSVLSRNDDKDIINNFKFNAKTHSNTDERSLFHFMQNTFIF